MSNKSLRPAAGHISICGLVTLHTGFLRVKSENVTECLSIISSKQMAPSINPISAPTPSQNSRLRILDTEGGDQEDEGGESDRSVHFVRQTSVYLPETYYSYTILYCTIQDSLTVLCPRHNTAKPIKTARAFPLGSLHPSQR